MIVVVFYDSYFIRKNGGGMTSPPFCRDASCIFYKNADIRGQVYYLSFCKTKVMSQLGLNKKFLQ